MTDYFIFRHGDTTETEKSAVQQLITLLGKKRDTHKLEILPKGNAALQKIGKYLKNIPTNANFCSPYPRCVNSAKIVGGISGKKFKTDERIKEFENNGEKFSSFYKRVSSFLNEIEKKNYPAVSICTHGAVIAALKHLKTSGKFYFFQVYDYPPPGNLLIIKGGKKQIKNFNRKTF